MAVYERFDDAIKNAEPEDYVVCIKWQGRELLIVTTPEPHRLPVPQVVVMRRPTKSIFPPRKDLS